MARRLAYLRALHITYDRLHHISSEFVSIDIILLQLRRIDGFDGDKVG
jgi:hypothetical protein